MEEKDEKRSFIKGTFVLAIAQLISKVLGAVYRIPLYLLIGSEGIGLVQMAYPVYSTVLALSTAGIPVAISKVVAEKLAKGHRAGAYKAFQVSLGILAVTGASFSLALFLSARYVAETVSKDPRAYYPLLAISPAIFFVAVMSAFRGFFQGQQDMVPTAISQVLEQILRVGTMFLLAFLLMDRGVEYAAAGATFGAVTGAIGGLAFLYIVYRRRLDLSRVAVYAPDGDSSVIGLLKEIIALAIPISLASIVMPIIQLIDMAVVPGRLQAGGASVAQATTMYGQLSGGAIPLINLPTVFTAALATSLVPSISSAFALRNLRLVSHRVALATRLTMIMVLPSAFGLLVLAEPIGGFLFDDPGIGVPLEMLAPGVIFIGLQMTTSGILQGLGRTTVPLKTLSTGAVTKLFFTWFLTPRLGIRGAALSSVAGFFVASALNYAAVLRYTGRPEDLAGAFLKPLFASAVMSFVARASHVRLLGLTGRGWISVPGAIVAAVLVYLAVLTVIGGLKPSDLEAIPRVGPAMSRTLGRLLDKRIGGKKGKKGRGEG
ncbi:MAG TPA: polysaccharide biosynthesis protein [Clostridia bacterium]|nr:polysaccharide biosynthesis protein [Clostridia bacterium]